MKTIFTILVGVSLASCAPPATDFSSVQMSETEGCLQEPQEQFGRYLGDWNIQDWQLSQDGKTWTEQKGARWNFVCVGNGIAVQDFWVPKAGGVGTNLRIFNPKTESWDIAWTASNLPGLTRINAKEDENGNIVMHYVDPPQNPPRRITFFAPTQEGWDWTLALSTDNEQTWRTVYKIKATRR